MARPIYEIAEDIIRDYKRQGKPVYYSAAPYVQAMRYLDNIGDSYGYDDARSVLTYALSNLRYWKGETATSVKAEIKELLGRK